MFGWLKSDPVKKLQQRRADLLARSVEYQRKGDLKTYSELVAEADQLDQQIQDLEKQAN